MKSLSKGYRHLVNDDLSCVIHRNVFKKYVINDSTSTQVNVIKKNHFKDYCKENVSQNNQISWDTLDDLIISDKPEIKIEKKINKELPLEKKIVLNDDDDILNIISSINDTVNSEIVENIKNNICPYCKSNCIDSDTLTCSECGIELRDNIDSTQEWRGYNGEDTNDASTFRCGNINNPFCPKNSIGTVLSGSLSNSLKKMHYWESYDPKERSLIKEFEEIYNVCSKNNISDKIIETTKILYYNVNKCKKKNGDNIILKNRKGMKGTSLLFASIINNRPLKTVKIAKMFDVDLKKLTKACATFLKLMSISNDISFDEELIGTPYCHIENFFHKYPNLSKDCKKLALDIAKNSIDLCIVTNHTPISIAAGSLMVMADVKNIYITPETIISNIGISETTVSKVYNKIKEHKNVVIDNEATKYILLKTRNINV